MIMRKLLITLAVTTLLASSAYAQERDAAEENAATKRSYSPYAGSEQPRNVYWGDTHLHTTYSADAGLVGNSKLGPDEAYRFARGEEVEAHNGMMA
jgi:hypothetical protein